MLQRVKRVRVHHPVGDSRATVPSDNENENENNRRRSGFSVADEGIGIGRALTTYAQIESGSESESQSDRDRDRDRDRERERERETGSREGDYKRGQKRKRNMSRPRSVASRGRGPLSTTGQTDNFALLLKVATANGGRDSDGPIYFTHIPLIQPMLLTRAREADLHLYGGIADIDPTVLLNAYNASSVFVIYPSPHDLPRPDRLSQRFAMRWIRGDHPWWTDNHFDRATVTMRSSTWFQACVLDPGERLPGVRQQGDSASASARLETARRAIEVEELYSGKDGFVIKWANRFDWEGSSADAAPAPGGLGLGVEQDKGSGVTGGRSARTGTLNAFKEWMSELSTSLTLPIERIWACSVHGSIRAIKGRPHPLDPHIPGLHFRRQGPHHRKTGTAASNKDKRRRSETPPGPCTVTVTSDARRRSASGPGSGSESQSRPEPERKQGLSASSSASSASSPASSLPPRSSQVDLGCRRLDHSRPTLASRPRSNLETCQPSDSDTLGVQVELEPSASSNSDLVCHASAKHDKRSRAAISEERMRDDQLSGSPGPSTVSMTLPHVDEPVTVQDVTQSETAQSLATETDDSSSSPPSIAISPSCLTAPVSTKATATATVDGTECCIIEAPSATFETWSMHWRRGLMSVLRKVIEDHERLRDSGPEYGDKGPNPQPEPEHECRRLRVILGFASPSFALVHLRSVSLHDTEHQAHAPTPTPRTGQWQLDGIDMYLTTRHTLDPSVRGSLIALELVMIPHEKLAKSSCTKTVGSDEYIHRIKQAIRENRPA